MTKFYFVSRTLIVVGCLLSFANYSVSAPAAAVTCAACHGGTGISPNPLWPNLAGQKSEYLKKQLQDYRAGRRSDPLMAPVAQSLSEDEIQALADYYSKL